MLRKLSFVLGVILVLLVPVAVWSPSAAAAAVPGVSMGLVATLSFDRYLPVLWSLLSLCAVIWVALLVNSSVIASVLLMALLGLATAMSGRVGMRSVAMQGAIFGAAALFPQPPPAGDIGSVLGATSTVAAVLVGGLVLALVFHVITRGGTPAKPVITPWPSTIANSVVLVLTLVIATYWVMSWDRTPVGAWLMVTIVVLAQPSTNITLWRSAERVVGTLLGAVLAAGIAVVMSATWQALVVGFIFVALAWSFRISHPVVETGHYYWIYAFLWTPAMVLLTVPQGGSETLSADGQRLVLTFLAAVSVAVVSILTRWGVALVTPPSANSSQPQKASTDQ